MAVLHGMTHRDDQHVRSAERQPDGIVVSRPRSTDAIGGALACAFAVARGLPAEIAAQLHRLDSIR